MVSLKYLPDQEKVGNFEHEIMRNEGKIRQSDREDTKRPEHKRGPILVGRSTLHMTIGYSQADVLKYIGSDPPDAERFEKFMGHVRPTAAHPSPVFTEITLVCSDGDFVITPNGIARRPRSRL